MAAIGVCTGAVGFLVKSFEEVIKEHKFDFVETFTQGADANLGVIWAWLTCLGLIMVAGSSLLVVYIAPEAAGGGIPEVIGCVAAAVAFLPSVSAAADRAVRRRLRCLLP